MGGYVSTPTEPRMAVYPNATRLDSTLDSIRRRCRRLHRRGPSASGFGGPCGGHGQRGGRVVRGAWVARGVRARGRVCGCAGVRACGRGPGASPVSQSGQAPPQVERAGEAKERLGSKAGARCPHRVGGVRNRNQSWALPGWLAGWLVMVIRVSVIMAWRVRSTAIDERQRGPPSSHLDSASMGAAQHPRPLGAPLCHSLCFTWLSSHGKQPRQAACAPAIQG